MSAERISGQTLDLLHKFRRTETVRNLVRVGAVAVIATGTVMSVDDTSENDIAALGLNLAGAGLVLYTGKRSSDEIDRLINLAERENGNPTEQ